MLWIYLDKFLLKNIILEESYKLFILKMTRDNTL